MSDGVPGGVLGAVLCGGRSRRMGVDKATVVHRGVPMAARVATALRDGGCTQVVALGGDPATLAPLGLVVVPDEFPGEGPLAAVAAAVESAGGRDLVVVACDLPEVTGEVIVALREALADGAPAAIATADGRHALCLAVAGSAGAVLRREVLAGARRIDRALETLGAVRVQVPGDRLWNVNTPGDVRQ